MKFDTFIKTISKIEQVNLPSSASHLKMAPLNRVKNLKSSTNNHENARKAAVMMLFYPKKDLTNLVLIIRNSYPGVHSSQIAFPGGKVEETDLDLSETALRETYEEIGIHPKKISIVRKFTPIYIPPSNFIVHPFFGISKSELEFNLQPDEVAGIIEITLSQLLDDIAVKSKIIETSYSKAINVPVFQFDEHSVWGATAMMLSELKDVIKMLI